MKTQGIRTKQTSHHLSQALIAKVRKLNIAEIAKYLPLFHCTCGEVLRLETTGLLTSRERRAAYKCPKQGCAKTWLFKAQLAEANFESAERKEAARRAQNAKRRAGIRAAEKRQ